MVEWSWRASSHFLSLAVRLATRTSTEETADMQYPPRTRTNSDEATRDEHRHDLLCPKNPRSPIGSEKVATVAFGTILRTFVFFGLLAAARPSRRGESSWRGTAVQPSCLGVRRGREKQGGEGRPEQRGRRQAKSKQGRSTVRDGD